MMRQKRKQILTITLLLAAIAGGFGPAMAQSMVETVMTDPLTGVAIDGYDPVSYFSEPQPLKGAPDYVYEWSGVPWYFASAANRDVFARNPDVYAPQFGGHCAMSMARGFISDGNPQLFVIEKAKLYLFYSVGNREAFLAAEETTIRSAVESWMRLKSTLNGPQEPMAASLPETSVAP